MEGQLLIDNIDAYTTYGVTLMDDGVDVLCAPAEMKDYVENSSRLEHGKHVIVSNPRMASREITLVFGILGENPLDFSRKKSNFVAKLQTGMISIQLPDVSNEVYHLIYKKNTSYAQNKRRTFCKLACKFTEPDPSDRT